MSFWDDDAGYELGDPKHPATYEQYAEYVDRLRKQRRESLSERGMESGRTWTGEAESRYLWLPRSESDCTCRRHAHDPDCNRHGQAA